MINFYLKASRSFLFFCALRIIRSIDRPPVRHRSPYKLRHGEACLPCRSKQIKAGKEQAAAVLLLLAPWVARSALLPCPSAASALGGRGEKLLMIRKPQPPSGSRGTRGRSGRATTTAAAGSARRTWTRRRRTSLLDSTLRGPRTPSGRPSLFK